jgi:hypothetical protein
MTARFRTAPIQMFAVTTVAIIVVAGAVWAKANAPQAGSNAAVRIDVVAVLSAADVAGLPVLQIDQPF